MMTKMEEPDNYPDREGWRHDHEAYFREEGTFAPDMLLWCERFRLVEVLDEAFAAEAAAHVAAAIAEAAAGP
jgi:hypothetical protein